MCDQQQLRSACTYAQSDQSLSYSLEYSMSVKLLTEHNLEFQSLKAGSSESTLVKMPHCWKSHVMAHFCLLLFFIGAASPCTCTLIDMLYDWSHLLCVFIFGPGFYTVPDTHLAEEEKAGGYALFYLFVLICPSQQFFSHVGMISCLPGLNQY